MAGCDGRFGDRGGGRRCVDDPHAMRACGDELGDSVGESAVRSDVEHRIRVFSLVHATVREDDGDEVDTRGVE